MKKKKRKRAMREEEGEEQRAVVHAMWLRSGFEAARGTQGVSVTVWAWRGLSDVGGFKVPAAALTGAGAENDNASGSGRERTARERRRHERQRESDRQTK